ncbi:MAG: hypothetical protein PHD81_04900 [Candidatus Nanoarchaeia archaeon]|nr:hypothetical protein [Candidatus Nanoarchaeia archaeon]MDD5588416.1 hypothetical protein [Candidatus Nanoarchaeia archaeon]
MKIIFFDLETQYLFKELNMISNVDRDPSKLKIAIAGVRMDGNSIFFNENQITELIQCLKDADLIVGHNLLRFDYFVLQPYINKNFIESLKSKTFDIMFELEKVTGCWTSLDDLGKRNLGMTKTIDTLKIPKMWRDGQHQEVKDYLSNDLIMTEAIFNHGKDVGKFKYEYKEYGISKGQREVIIDWKNMKAKKGL